VNVCLGLQDFSEIFYILLFPLGRFARQNWSAFHLSLFAICRNIFRDGSIASTDSYEKTEKKFPSKVVREYGTRRRVRCHVVVAVGSGRLGVNLFRKSTDYAAVVAEGEGRQASRSFGKTSTQLRELWPIAKRFSTFESNSNILCGDVAWGNA